MTSNEAAFGWLDTAKCNAVLPSVVLIFAASLFFDNNNNIISVELFPLCSAAWSGKLPTINDNNLL